MMLSLKKSATPSGNMGFFSGMLGIVDLLAAGALVSLYFGHPIYHLQAGMGLALVAKGLLFMPNVLSIIDVVIGIAMFVLFWIAAPQLALIMGLWLVYKGITSWF